MSRLRPFVQVLVFAATSLPLATPAQAPSSSPTTIAFDVVTIKRATSSLAPPSVQSAPDGDSILITNMSPRMVLGFAYDLGIHDMVYGLPTWADSQSYNITAKVAAADLPAFRKLLPRQRNPMLRPLLAERFHLQAHFESKQLPAYALVVARGGPRLTAVQPAAGPDGRPDPGGIHASQGVLTGVAAPIAPLLDALPQQLGRPVVDRTGLTGRYNFTLRFAPAQASTDAQPDAGPSIFTAVEQDLGLRLEPSKAPIPVLIVDHIEQPSEN